ncbi:MAG TPA: SAF domain-containing protein [Thermoflexales bacterium]|nr:SAF domain-containing protein [Thermoflexales bacterium]
MALKDKLRERAAKQGPLRVGLVGAGQMGTGLISQIERMEGAQVVAVADVVPGRPAASFVEASVKASVKEINDAKAAADHIRQSGRVAMNNADEMARIENVDVIVEATGVPEVGAKVCLAAIQAGKHIINMNVETDATVGYILNRKAKEAGVIYSLAAGDEPGAIKEIYDFADVLGFDIVMVGKGKNNPLDRTATPDTCAARAAEQQMSPKMLCSFVDGTKTMVEMTSIGNGLGFPPEITGAHGPACEVKDLAKVFVPQSEGGILKGTKVVDYAVGSVAPGVFVIITTDQPKIIKDLKYLRLNGHGNNWALYRPYHLANLETPMSIVRAVIYGEATLATEHPFVAETIAYAKRDLNPGDKVDALGGFTVYGMIERADVARKGDQLPLGLAVGGVIKHAVAKGQPIRYADIDLNETQTIVKLRREQDAL